MDSGKPTIFIVDDDASFRRALERLLVVNGYQVEPFASALEFMASSDRTSRPGRRTR